MAKFLNTTGVSYHLEELIKATKERLIIISPYLQLSETIKTLLSDLNERKRDIRFIYRENKLQVDDNKWLEKQIGIRTSICKNLHAKCYLNESEAIITSMNLYEFSQLNNYEMGIHITKVEDPDLFSSTLMEAQRLLRISEEIRVTVQKILPSNQDKNENKKICVNYQTPNSYNLPTGFCIRTGERIPFDINKPLTKDAFKKWNIYANPEYPEKFCHFSGEASYGETSVYKPILPKFWKKASSIHHLI